MKAKDIFLELISEIIANGDGVFNISVNEYLSVKDSGLLSRDDIIYILDNIPKIIDPKRFKWAIDSDDIDTLSNIIYYVIEGYKEDPEIFITVLKTYHQVLKLVRKRNRTISLTDDKDYIEYHGFYHSNNHTAKVFSSFNLNDEILDTAEKYIIDNIDDFTVDVVYSNTREYYAKRKRNSIKKLCRELEMNFPFTEKFILKNYNLFIPWILLKNSNIKNNQLIISECIFGDMTSNIFTEISKYVNGDTSIKVNINKEDASSNALAYLLINKEGEN